MDQTALQQRERLIIGLLPDIESAKRLLAELHAQGVPEDRIGLVLRQPETSAEASDKTGSPAAAEVTTGALGGGVIGGLAGLLAATGIVTIPGLGPLLAGGALVSTLGATGASVMAGAGVGAATGGLAGGLISINVPETAAQQYEDAVRQGRVLITVRTAGDAAEIETLLTRHGAETRHPS